MVNGSLAGAKWELLEIIVPISVLSTLFFYTQSRILNLLLLGDEAAITLGKIYIYIDSAIYWLVRLLLVLLSMLLV